MLENCSHDICGFQVQSVTYCKVESLASIGYIIDNQDFFPVISTGIGNFILTSSRMFAARV